MLTVKTAMVKIASGLDIIIPHTIFVQHVEGPYGHKYISYVPKRRSDIYIMLFYTFEIVCV